MPTDAQTDLPGAGDAAAPGDTVELLVTAEEGYPALERLFLGARQEIWAGFRVFDLSARLRSPEGRAIGETWADLFLDRLRAGVTITFLLCDFDPTVTTPLHFMTVRSIDRFAALAAAEGTGGRLHFRAARHPARFGIAAQLFFWPFVLRRLRRALPEEPDWRDCVARSDVLSRRVSVGTDGAPRVAWFPPPVLHPSTHHQKLAVVDRSRLYIGGLDIDERRYDDLDHERPAPKTWHDVSVITGGQVASDAQAHLEALWAEAAADVPLDVDARRRAPATAPAFLRTLSKDGSRNPFRMSPHTTVREIEQAHFRLFERARRLIYLESQFFRHHTIADALAKAAARNPSLGLIVMIPAAPEEAAFMDASTLDVRYGEYLQSRCIRRVQKAFGDRAFIGMPIRPVARDGDGRDVAYEAGIIYIHSKVSIADDDAALITSANLNGRSLRWDTEAGIALAGEATVAPIRRRLFEHWLPGDAGTDAYDPATAVARWREIGERNAATPPTANRGFIAPFDPRPGERIGFPIPGLAEEAV